MANSRSSTYYIRISGMKTNKSNSAISNTARPPRQRVVPEATKFFREPDSCVLGVLSLPSPRCGRFNPAWPPNHVVSLRNGRFRDENHDFVANTPISRRNRLFQKISADFARYTPISGNMGDSREILASGYGGRIACVAGRLRWGGYATGSGYRTPWRRVVGRLTVPRRTLCEVKGRFRAWIRTVRWRGVSLSLVSRPER